MGSENIIIPLGAILIGAIFAYLLLRNKRILQKISKADDKINKVINNPDLLLEKLNENGKMYEVDTREELKYSVVEKNGERKLDLERVPYSDSSKGKGKDKGKGKGKGKK